MTNAQLIRVEYDGRMVTLRQLAAMTGKPYSVLYGRIVKYKWPVDRAVMCPVRCKDRETLGNGPVSTALSLAGDEGWMVALPLAVVLMAIQDYKRPLYRDGVRRFFCGGQFEKLFLLDGTKVYERLTSLVG